MSRQQASGLLRGLAFFFGRLPFPGQEYCHALDGMVGDAGMDVVQIAFRVEAAELGGLDEGVNGSGALDAFVGVGEDMVLAAKCHGAG